MSAIFFCKFNMILRTCQFSRIIGTGIEDLRTVSPWVLGTNRICKRYAGHSQYQNRKGSKEAGAKKKSDLIRKYQFEINRVVRMTKDANPATNTRLQAVLGDAMKHNVPKTNLENFLKIVGSTLAGDCINKFVYTGPFGITSLIEISSIHSERAKAQTTSAIKKFGFQLADGNTITTIGIITCKPKENVSNSFDKAMEDAITANCEEIMETDDNFIEFQCNTNNIDSCVKKLTELGYEVQNSECRHIFSDMVKIDDESVLDKLDKMEEKLQQIPGFMRICYNLE